MPPDQASVSYHRGSKDLFFMDWVVLLLQGASEVIGNSIMPIDSHAMRSIALLTDVVEGLRHPAAPRAILYSITHTGTLLKKQLYLT